MKIFYSAEDIQSFADQGRREISIDDKIVLTDLAKQTAHMLGIRITGNAFNVSPETITTARPESVGMKQTSVAKPRGCQRRPAFKSTPPSGPLSGGSSQIVDRLVETVKRIHKKG
jgi:hypothetical protein